MSYRDDREALHARIEQLQTELAEARHDGNVEQQKSLDDLREELRKKDAQIAKLRGGRAGPRRTAVIIAVSVLGVSMLGAVWLMGKTASRPIAMPPARTAVVTTSPLAPPTTPARTTKVEPLRSTTATWNARVTRAEGVALAPGASCVIEATVTTKDTNALVPSLSIQCGAVKLYRSTDALSGMSQSSNDARELLGPADDKSTFTLVYRDIGTRTGERSQVDIDTNVFQAEAFRETIPRFRVSLSVTAASTTTPPLADGEHRLRRSGKVTAVTGAAPTKVGASCVLRAMPSGQQRSCVAEVACGAAIVWPTTAPVTCTYDGSRPITVGNTGEPSMGLVGSELEVKTKAYGATITLDDP